MPKRTLRHGCVVGGVATESSATEGKRGSRRRGPMPHFTSTHHPMMGPTPTAAAAEPNPAAAGPREDRDFSASGGVVVGKRAPSSSSWRRVLMVCGAVALLVTCAAALLAQSALAVPRQRGVDSRSSSTSSTEAEGAAESAATSTQRRRRQPRSESKRPVRKTHKASAAARAAAAARGAAAVSAEFPAHYDGWPWQKSARHERLLAKCARPTTVHDARASTVEATLLPPPPPTTIAGAESVKDMIAAKKEARSKQKAAHAEDARQQYCAAHDLARNCSVARRAKWQSPADAAARVRAPVFIKTHKVGGTTFGSLLQTVAGRVFLTEQDAADAAELPADVRSSGASGVFGLRECDFAKSSRLGRSGNCDWCCGQHQAKDVLERCGLRGFKDLCVPDDHQVYVTLLRRPLDRLLSMFFFHRDYKMDAYVREMSARMGAGRAFQAWLEPKMDHAAEMLGPVQAVDHALVLPTFSNIYFRTCTGDVGTVSMFEAARRALDAVVDVVGFQEHFDDAVVLTALALDWPIEEFARANNANARGGSGRGGADPRGNKAGPQQTAHANETVHLRANPHDQEVAGMEPAALAAVQTHPYFLDELAFYEYAQAIHRRQRQRIVREHAAARSRSRPRGGNAAAGGGDLNLDTESAFATARSSYFAHVGE